MIKNRQQLLTILAAAVVALFLADRVLLTPLAASWKARSERVAELRKEVAQGETLIDRSETIRERWQWMRTNALPSNLSAAENEMLRAFDRWSQESRISISSIRPQGRAGDGFTILECRTDGFGSMAAVSRFLFNLEADPAAFRVESAELVSQDGAGQQLSLALQVTGLILEEDSQ